MINLRGHHVLCILTHSGHGYTPELIATMDKVIGRINAGEAICIVKGKDDICAALDDQSCDHSRVCVGRYMRGRDGVAHRDVAIALQMPLNSRFMLGKGEVKYLRDLFRSGAIRATCHECPWHEECTRVAHSEYRGVKLLPHAVP